MSGHTKGTWRAQSMVQGGIKMFAVLILDEGKKSGQRWAAIATTRNLEEEEANAKLMAAAPVLLETLRGMIDRARDSDTPMTATEIAARAVVAELDREKSVIELVN